jgi:tetratricopeptide (TPR) repeat protein
MMRDAGLTIGRVRAARAMGWSYLLDGRFEKAKATMAWALGELEKSESVTTLSDIYVAIRWMQGAIDLYSDDYETAEKRLVETYDLAMKAPNLTVQTSAATNIAQLHFQRGEYAKSKEWGERSLAMAREIGHLSALWSAAVITMVSCVELGETDSLEEYMALIEEGVEGGTTIFLSTHLIGQALLATGEVARARRIAALAEVRVGGRLREVYTNLALGDVLHQDGRKNWDEALRHYDNALNGARQIALRSAEGVALLGMARLSLDKGDREAARESARTARDLLEALDHRHGVARADAVLRQLGEGA